MAVRGYFRNGFSDKVSQRLKLNCVLKIHFGSESNIPSALDHTFAIRLCIFPIRLFFLWTTRGNHLQIIKNPTHSAPVIVRRSKTKEVRVHRRTTRPIPCTSWIRTSIASNYEVLWEGQCRNATPSTSHPHGRYRTPCRGSSLTIDYGKLAWIRT